MFIKLQQLCTAFPKAGTSSRADGDPTSPERPKHPIRLHQQLKAATSDADVLNCALGRPAEPSPAHPPSPGHVAGPPLNPGSLCSLLGARASPGSRAVPSCPSCLSRSSFTIGQAAGPAGTRRQARGGQAGASPAPRSCRRPSGPRSGQAGAQHTLSTRGGLAARSLAAPARRSQPKPVNSTGGCGGAPCAGPERVLTERRLRSRARGPQRTWQRRPRSRPPPEQSAAPAVASRPARPGRG